MTTAAAQLLSRTERRRLIVRGLLRALGVAAGLVVLYFIAPLDHMSDVPLWLSLTIGVLALNAVSVYQVRTIIRAPHPALRAIEALAVIAPLFVILFAATYFLMGQANGNNFSAQGLTRTDTLYFTVTVFASVGFGDITATSETARLLVTAQMILDLVVLGAVVRVFLGAVQIARQDPAQQEPEPL